MAYHHYASATASIWRPVSCEHCKGDFAYLMTRSGQGYARSGVFVDYDVAREGARGGAEVSLEQKMEEDFDPVPCPDCGKYQEYMFRALRERKFKWMKFAGAGGLLFGLLMLVARRLLEYQLRHGADLERELANALSWMAVGMIAVAGGAVLFAYKWLMENFDPNAKADARAKLDLSRSQRLLRRKDYERMVERANDADRAKLAKISWKGAKNVARVAS
jgi:hypothetical protein